MPGLSAGFYSLPTPMISGVRLPRCPDLRLERLLRVYADVVLYTPKPPGAEEFPPFTRLSPEGYNFIVDALGARPRSLSGFLRPERHMLGGPYVCSAVLLPVRRKKENCGGA